ncbi:unnamed protein product [Eruca vesicaria subsp. sativa]|uniref:Uncharacterized protein n=1 Tax=Eruca vesicaria subsp. sativa TaxID=29727 RepID=A0ABC8JIR2_ERUVS|nr:unnamed protein product [Eruca vesicaria subsp. sativa]
MKNKEENTRKRKQDYQPIFLTPVDFQLSRGTNLDLSSVRPVLSDVSNTTPTGEPTQQFTHPSNVFSSANPNYDKGKGKLLQYSKRFGATSREFGGDNQCNFAQNSNNISSRSTCLKIKPANLLQAFSKSDSNKQTTLQMPSINKKRMLGEEDGSFEPIIHYSYEVEDYSDTSYDLTSKESDSDSEVGANIERESVACSVPDEQRSRILRMADIFKTMFQDIVSPLG